MPTTRPARDTGRIEQAIECLRHARRLLRKAGCKRAAQRVRGAIKSADGARRHAVCLETRSESRTFHDVLHRAMGLPPQSAAMMTAEIDAINALLESRMGLEEPHATEARHLAAQFGAT